MASSVNNPEDVVNLALAQMGFKSRIGSLYDGSMAAKAALTVYAQTRDAVLRANDWDFSEQIAVAVLTGNAAPAPWAYEYTYPVNCLKLRALFGANYPTDMNNPIPSLWKIGNSVAGSGAEVIWSQVASATLVFTAQVTKPSSWNAGFIEAFVSALALRLSALLPSSVPPGDLIKANAEIAPSVIQTAASEIG